MRPGSIVLTLCCCFALCGSCTKDRGVIPVPVAAVDTSVYYSGDIAPLLRTHCAVPGCHQQGFPFGNYERYEEVKRRVDNGKFQRLVIDLRLMPPSGRPPLTEDQVQMLTKWLRDGAPEN